MKISQVLMVVLLSVGASVASTAYVFSGRGATQTPETAFERVMRTGVLRCGYYVFAPITIRDLKTGELSGLGVDMINHVAAGAHLKVEWTEEVDFGNWIPGLKAGRFDAMCTSMWPEAALAREVSFTRPSLYSGINVYARGDDHRFDGNLAALDSPDVTIAVIEGTPQESLAALRFPKAKLLRLPQNSPGGAQPENVATKKADVLLWDENGVFEYLKTNPGGLHNVAPGQPVKVMPFELAVKLGEYQLRDLLDVGVQNMEDSGVGEMLIRKWERVPGSFYLLQKPYLVSGEKK